MNLIVVHKLSNQPSQDAHSLLKLAFTCRPVTDVVVKRLSEWNTLRPDDFLVAVPGEWKRADNGNNRRILFYNDKAAVPSIWSSFREKTWYVVSNGRFLVSADTRLLSKTVERLGCDVVAVNIDPNLRAGSEKVHTDSKCNLLGFRLLYADTIQPVPIPSDWPHYLFINSRVANLLFSDKIFSDAFGEFINRCKSCSATIVSIGMGGTSLDLNTEEGLLSMLPSGSSKKPGRNGSNGDSVPAAARLFGEVLFGRNVDVDENTIITGPSVLCDSVKAADGAIIQSSIIGPDVSIPAGAVVRNRVITDSTQILQQPIESSSAGFSELRADTLYSGSFRTWPKLSYARCVKRIADVIVALIVLVIFMPFVPVIAVIIKLSSRGPVFYKGIRQGLQGRPFACYKFRTMQVGAHRLQDELQDYNEADGPQFVITDDPRMSRVGRFLRETYIDEIPQFFAVLLGQMSVVGPRPSPESENVRCPFWRDARLSVKPGVTGLWQVCRTRKRMRDFQEWIHYDVEYVRNLSPALDLWICLKTFLKMLKNFVRQFQ
ncbi:MAG: sugar transferase [Sedimentisphaerales bacterium]|nr:sugar transferase [Sedimentisphaerales bacterium]